MTTKTKGRSGGDRPTLKSKAHEHFNLFRTSIKAGIVRLALCGLVSASFATWLIQRGGLKDV